MKTWTMSKTWQIARRLLYQNRWIYLFLMLWPFGMAAILLVPAAKPEIEDVLSILHQECLYGLGLVAFTGGALLGNEQRSRRIASVLSRAVSRRQYFFALVSAAWLPLALYVVSFVISGIALLSGHRSATCTGAYTGPGATCPGFVDRGRGSFLRHVASHDAGVHGLFGAACLAWLPGLSVAWIRSSAAAVYFDPGRPGRVRAPFATTGGLPADHRRSRASVCRRDGDL